MKSYNLIIIEDDRDLAESYKEYFKSNILIFRDLKTFEVATENGNIWQKLKKKIPLIIIIDVMLAEELDHNEKSAPRWTDINKDPDEIPPELKKKIRSRTGVVPHTSDLQNINRKKYINYELGLQIGKDIRMGKFSSVKADTPILFITARQAESIQQEFGIISNSDFLSKPFWFEDIEEKIQVLLNL